MKQRLRLNYYKISYAILALLLSCCTADCGHMEAAPIKVQYTPHGVLGAPMIQCDGSRPRQVQCASGMEDRGCEALHEAMDYINFETGLDIFFWVGRIANEKDWKPTVANLMVHYGVRTGKGDENAVMATTLVPEMSSGCIKLEHIAVFDDIATISQGSLVTFFRHELGHAMGLPHEESGFHGLMQTAFPADMLSPVDFSEREIRLVKAMYPWAQPPSWREHYEDKHR